MSENDRKSVHQHAIIVLIILSIALIAWLTYAPVLRYVFTAADSLTLIDTSRIQSLKDVVRIFTTPLMAGTQFTEYALYYRPIASLSYSLDYYVWGLNPFGYHLTDLILHIMVSALVFMVMLLLTGGRKAISWLSAVIFTTHPILVESVPAIARRHDIIAALFLLLSLAFFLNHMRKPTRQRNWSLIFSVLTYALALGAKEIAILLPLIICGYLLLFSHRMEANAGLSRGGTFQAMKICFSYFAVSVIYMVWRICVLHGIGGLARDEAFGFSAVIWLFQAPFRYFSYLLYPVRLHGAVSANLVWATSVVASFVVLMFLFIKRKVVFTNMQCSGDRPAYRSLKLPSAGTALLSLIGILSYPLVSPFIDELVRQAYDGRGPVFLVRAMEGRYSAPVAYYVDRVGKVSVFCLFMSFGVSVTGLFRVSRLSQLKSFLTGSYAGRTVAFLLVWLLLPLGLFLATRTLDPRSMYTSVIPFSGILSIALIGGLGPFVRRLNIKQVATSSDWLPHATGGSLIVVGGLIVYLLSFSPIARTYGEWEESGKLSAMVLHELSKAVTHLPNDNTIYTIHVYDLPTGIGAYQTRIPRAQSVSYLDDYSIKSYLDLTNPDKRTRVVLESSTILSACPKGIHLETGMRSGNNVLITVKPEWGGDGSR